MKKKMICLVLCLLMLAPLCAAGAEEASAVTANATVDAVNTVQLTAPFAGVLLPYDWDGGERVSSGDVVLEMDTTKLYAPADGVLQGVFAEEGDLCEDVIAQYGKIANIEKPETLVISATTSGRYNSDENKELHVGSTVYVEQTDDTDNTGEGRITALNGNAYSVELTAGEFVEGDQVKLYRDEKMGSKTCVGSGTLVRGEDVAVQGSGRILKSYCRQGQQVKKGQLLFELASADCAPTVTSGQLKADCDGVLELKAASGQQVYKGQLLAVLHDLSAMEVTAQVDEVDLDKVHIGDTLKVVFDRYPDTELSGTVLSISGLGVQKQNATYYDVKLSLSTSLELLPGMNATVYLPNQG